jgi:small-conductance mechanosensitive channel
LIGRYGVKVGDRVTISGVTGEVIDIGLIRVYLMELAGTGVVSYPTGRVVVFANSALFSASTPLYKQIPGTDFTWHELQADLTADGDVKAVRDLLLAAVMSVYNEYKGGFERQHSSVQRIIDIRLETPQPVASVRLAETGVEAVIRYPVDIRHSSETDAKVTERVLDALNHQPTIKAGLSGPPKVRVATKV